MPLHRQELKQAPALLLSEVFDSYDEDPLYLFKKEAYSHRAIAWSNRSIIIAAWITCKKYTWILYEHMMLNRFAVGVFSSMQLPVYGKKAGMYSALTGVKKTFCFSNTEKTFEESTAHYTTEQQSSLMLPYPGWASYYQELQQRLGNTISITGFYALPTLEAQRRAYQLAFASKRPEGTVMVGPPSLLCMQNLSSENLWFDGVHPQKEGAVLFTQWIADEIIKKWPALKAKSCQTQN